MAWMRMRSLFSPLKKLWIRMHSAQNKKRGIYILYEDVKSCPCEDVQILWSILVESSHSHPPPLRLKHRLPPAPTTRLRLRPPRASTPVDRARRSNVPAAAACGARPEPRASALSSRLIGPTTDTRKLSV